MTQQTFTVDYGLTIVGGDTIDSDTGNIAINANGNTWTFDNTGMLTVPGNIVMPPGSSLLSTGASPAPNISGFNSASFGADVTATGNITGGNLRALTNLYVEAANGNLVLGDATATASPGLSSTNSITVTANRAGTPKEWVFTNSGALFAPGNITGSGNILASERISAAGNVIGGNIFTPGVVSAIGNITGPLVAPGGNGQVLYHKSSGLIGASPNGFSFDDATQTLFVNVGSFSGEADGTNALFVGNPGYTELGSNILGQFSGNVDSYSQINLQNISNAAIASSDYIVTADNGTDTTYFIDLGISSSGYDYPGFSAIGPNDGYLFVAGADQAGPSNGTSNLNLGSTNGNIRSWIGAGEVGNIITTVHAGGLNVAGQVSATGNITGNNMSLTGNIVGNISFTGTDITINNAPGGQEGGEIKWALPAPANTVLSTSLTQDVFQNGMRFFETGGTNRGLYMDLGNVPNGSNTAVGYRDIPQVSFTGNTTIATTDAGRHYYSTLSTGNVLTIANNASQGFQIGAAITIVNQGSGAITVAQGSGVTLYLAGNVTAGNRTVATFGMATIMKVATDTWFINGTGVS